jgi:ubiquinol-cytochrome c reductase cytochrome b subunit
MSRAYESVLRLSFDVQAGLVFRQIHHWAALVMVGSVAAHASRVFFTGAFRKPRDISWMLGVTLLLLTIAIGFAGYSLPDDLLSGTGLRIAYSIALAIPFIGTWLAFLVFGGHYPSPDILNRLFVLHVMILPGAIAAVLSLHLAIVWRQKHTHFPGGKPERTEQNIQGERLFPRYAFKSAGLFLVLGGILGLLGGLAQINPVWLYGPYNPATVSGGSQPDWYVGWLEGALRLFPGWEFRAFGHEIPAPFFPGVVLPGIVFTVMFLWPAIERRITGDRLEHNLLNFPRDLPWRTALGAAVLVFMTVLTVAGGNDLIAAFFGVSVEAMTRVLRVLVFVLPVLAYAVTYYLMRELRRSDLHPIRRAAVTTVVRTREGGFEISDEHVGGGIPNPEGEEAASPEVVRD